jgi:hypothetical protein
MWLVGDLNKIPPAVLDGVLAVAVAVFLFQQGMLGSEESWKYFDPSFLYYCKFFIGSLAVGAMALKTFRANPGTRETKTENKTQ